MRTLLRTTILSYVLMIVLAVYSPITRKYAKLDALLNQTSYGYFRMSNVEIQRVPSVWMQDDLNKRVRIDVGKRGEPGFMAEYYFFINESYEVYLSNDNRLKCKKVPDFNYTMEISTYAEPNFGFLGRHTLQEYSNVTADLYAGQAVDAAGPMNCIFYCDPETCKKYLGMLVIGSANKISFLEYWYADNMTSTVPSASWFNLPNECTTPEIEYYFASHNIDGSPKTDSSATTQSPCPTQNNKNSFSIVMQRSMDWL